MSVAITRWASAPSRLARASTESAISFSARPPISETLRASSCRSTSKALAVCSDIMANLAFPPVGFSPLPEAAGDVVLRAPVSRRGEYLAGGVEFDQLAEIHKGREVGNPRRLLHVVGDDHDRIVFLELVDQLFDLGRRDRVERRARLVQQDDLRADRNGAGDAQPLLLSTGEAEAIGAELVLDLVPQRRPRQRRLHAPVQIGP